MKEDISIEKLPGGNLHVHIPMVLKKKSGRKLVITPNASNAPGSEEANTYGLTNEPMLVAIAHALEWSELLESGKIKSVSELSRQLDMDGSFVTRLLRLSTLAPDILEKIAKGKEPNGLSLNKLLAPFPNNWEEQRKQFGFSVK